MKRRMEYESLGYPNNFENHPLSGIIKKIVKKGPVLDVGCGNGNLLELLKNRFEVEGFDISKMAVDLTRKKGIKAKVASLDNFKSKKKFKTILLIGFLVLSRNPKKDLEKIINFLDKEGVIILTVPNASSPKNLLRFNKRYQHQIYFPHFFEFKNFLKKNGFEIIKKVRSGKMRLFPFFNSVNLYVVRPSKKRFIIS